VHTVSTLQVVEKQEVVGVEPDEVPVTQSTSQLVIGGPVLQGTVVIVDVGVISFPLASSASSSSVSAIFAKSIKGVVSASSLAVPSRMADIMLWIESRNDPALLT
jgi:hypothetical protein